VLTKQRFEDRRYRRCSQSSSRRQCAERFAHESQLVQEVLRLGLPDQLPGRPIGAKAYARDRLDRHLLENYGIELIAPHLSSRQHPTQDRTVRLGCIKPLLRHISRLGSPVFFSLTDA
jgi:hypothetical protein